MYEAFDTFLKVETWHTSHPSDDERFYQALHTVVKRPGFNADKMREHMRQRIGLKPDDHESYYSRSIDTLASQAWAVADYLKANGL